MAAAVSSLLGCGAHHHQTFSFGSPDLEAAFHRWKDTAPPKDRETIEQLEQDETVTIHFITGSLNSAFSRGTATRLAYSKRGDLLCRMRHPVSDAVPHSRDFDIIYDDEAAAVPYKFPNPPEPLFHHEFFGHIVPALNDPILLDAPWDENEPFATERENEYRKYVGLLLAPPYVRRAVGKKVKP